MLIAPFTLTNLLTGFFFVTIGYWYYKHPPKNINSFSGYRTQASMRNQQTWNEGNRYSSRIMIIIGAVMLTIGLLSFFILFLQELHVLIAAGFTIIAALSIMLFTERHLEKKFDNTGNVKDR